MQNTEGKEKIQRTYGYLKKNEKKNKIIEHTVRNN